MLQTIHEAAAAIRQRQRTPADLVEQCLAQVDRWEDHVRAWVFVDRDGARAEAKRLTDDLQRGHYRGPLHGIPIGVKDIFDVFDWPTAAGSQLWANSIARADADVVRQLRQAGAIFLGKTVTTAYASFDPPVTRNPWDLSRTPGGSSSGSAAAVATGMCLGALGSQTGGSITRPASYCGVAGCKPTYDRVSVRGVVPLAHSMDHPGPIARCVKDLDLLLRPMIGTGAIRAWPRSREAAQTITIACPGGLFADLAEPAVLDALQDVQSRLSGQGARLRDVGLPAGFAEVLPRHRTIMAVEAAQFHEPRLRRHPDDYPPRIRELLEEGLRCPAPEYARCREHQAELSRAMHDFMGHADDTAATRYTCLLTPATTGPAPGAETTGNPAFNSPWSYLGMPTISIPTGQLVDGLPLAIQLVGDRWREDELFYAAAWCEKALGVRALNPPLPR